MTVHVARDGIILGTFSDEELGTAIAAGTLRSADFGWREGMTDWVPIMALLPQPPQAAIKPDGLAPAQEENAATEKQLDFIEHLSGQRPIGVDKEQASELIDQLRYENQPAKGPPPASWETEPASPAQFELIHKLDGNPDPSITKAKAGRLIPALLQQRARADAELAATQPAYYLSARVQEASVRVAEAEKKRSAKSGLSDLKYKLEYATRVRLDWWGLALGKDVDACSSVYDLSRESLDIAISYYHEFGCGFRSCPNKYIMAVLEALDRERPGWDKENPAKFFEVLWGNFPKLRRKR